MSKKYLTLSGRMFILDIYITQSWLQMRRVPSGCIGLAFLPNKNYESVSACIIVY